MSAPHNPAGAGDQSAEKPWGGRFEGPTNKFVEAFTASVEFDRRLYAHDIQGSIAHATMLAAAGVLSTAERDQIVTGLKQIRAEIDAGQFNWSVALEDV
ncbi:MAG: argininosuccinate lyase, partial [Betaproteobacteria bacterium]|nr:argininosuccinate lyase [Betaproteobacteria bacterium]